ncbi:nuclear pore glycoprotein p62-like [Diabrotica virgifera virgifera]|uniref:Nuclear pore glycoprotein p62-like isoform X1 n=1 Tax=Diabrotica virgifera virgifera TaxID=50390 RepID=A0A6P7H027_DIAVI|nr:nuclear pore glycoprotein p62-like [Diabrotica virgifera virgifera]
MSFSFGATPTPPQKTVASGFTLPSNPIVTSTTGFQSSFGSGDNKDQSKPSLFATPSSQPVSFGLTTKATTAPTTLSFGFATPTTVPFGSSTTITPATTPQFGLSLPKASVPATTTFSLLGSAPATTAAAPTGISFGTATTTATTSATGLSFGTPIGTATTTATTSASGLSFGLTTASSTSSAAPTLLSSTTTSTTSSVSASGALSSTTSAPTFATSSLSSTGTLTFSQLEDSINKWTMDLEEQGKFFINQAKQLNAWDTLLISNGEKILTLNSSIEKVKQQQQQLDQELDFVLAQQKELEELIVPIEKELLGIPVTDIDRNQMYQFSEIVDSQLKQMSDDLKEVIEHINEANKEEEASNPLSQISRILNAHMNSLQWIDRSTAQISSHLEQIGKMQDSNRRNHSFNNSMNF